MAYTTDLAYYKIKQLEGENEELRKKCTYFEKLSTERLKATEELHQQLEELEEEIGNLREKNKQLNNDNTALQHTVDDFVVKCKDLHQQLDAECKKKCDLQERLDDVGKRYYESSMRVGKLVREKEDLQNQLGSSNAALERLRERYKEEVVCRRKWAKLAGYRDKRIEELLKTGYGIDVDEVYKLKGMEELWAMLGTMYAADPIEVTKIFGWSSINNIAHYTPDVKEFLKKYETWKGCVEEKKKEKEETCIGCPFESDEFKCGYGFHDSSAISDEELKKYYEVARATEKEHKFEYGDAVRVPWRDYDYMYIGPEAKHIRLFNPKTHTVVYVSPNEHLEFRNSRIIVCEEEDLKKIRKG